MSFLDDLDGLMMPHRCEFDKALNPDEWYELYDWLSNTCGAGNSFIEKNVICFKKEEHLIWFKLRWL